RDRHRRQLGHRAARGDPRGRARRRRDPHLQPQPRRRAGDRRGDRGGRRGGRGASTRPWRLGGPSGRRRGAALRGRPGRGRRARDWFDYLVNNAGFGQMAMFADTTDDPYDRFHRVILKGPYFLTQTLLPLLADGGAIVNTTSNSALRPEAGYSAYAVMKGGL